MQRKRERRETHPLSRMAATLPWKVLKDLVSEAHRQLGLPDPGWQTTGMIWNRHAGVLISSDSEASSKASNSSSGIPFLI